MKRFSGFTWGRKADCHPTQVLWYLSEVTLCRQMGKKKKLFSDEGNSLS